MAHKSQEQFRIHVGARGRLVLPAKLRKKVAIADGDEIVATVQSDGSLRLVTLREQVRKAMGILRDLAPGRSLSRELIAERRREAARE